MKNIRQFGIIYLLESQGRLNLLYFQTVPGFDVADLDALVLNGEVSFDGTAYFIQTSDHHFEKFRVFAKAYPGKKKGSEFEWANFKKKHKNFSVIVAELLPNLERQIEERRQLQIAINAALNSGNRNHGMFLEPWPHLTTYINQGRWTMQYFAANKGGQISAFYKKYLDWFKTITGNNPEEWTHAVLSESELQEWTECEGDFKTRRQVMSPEGAKIRFRDWHIIFCSNHLLRSQYKTIINYIKAEFKNG